MDFTNEAFLQACPPPWAQFPDLEPELLLRYLQQGETEWWFDEIWRPFWCALTREQKDRYLDHWRATSEWRGALTVFEVDPAFDVEADARESEEYLTGLRQEHEGRKRQSFWMRVFRRGR